MNTSRLTALVLLGMILCVVLGVLFPIAALKITARLLLVAYLVLEWRRMAVNARIMVGLSAVLTAASAQVLPDPMGMVVAALDSGAFLATFFANQFFLREAASSSPLVRRCSHFFVNQRPGRRYALLTLGSYLFGIILNLGVLSLLGIMIRQRNSLAAAGGHAEVKDARERRMVLALLRGFSVTPLASPLSVSLAVLLTALPNLHWSTILPLGLLSGAIVLGLGWLQDQAQAPRHLRHLAPAPSAPRDLPALAAVVGLVLLVFLTALAIEAALDVALSRAMLVSTPLVGLAWLARQYVEQGFGRAAALVRRRVVKRAVETFPAYRTEIGILSCAGFIGSLFIALVPPQSLSGLLTAPMVPPLLLPAALMLTVILPALAGINPIVTVTILASALQTASVLPIPGEVMALALISGWSLSVNSSPLTASAMLLGQLVGKPADTIVTRWNGPFTAVTFAALAALQAGLILLKT
ncbi:conserved membrane hypothetical protein [Candidatus Terasakiella magnetica]|nr:conserved membrane hypothetical protein [Candidatus Terasakiella magnetica]